MKNPYLLDNPKHDFPNQREYSQDRALIRWMVDLLMDEGVDFILQHDLGKVWITIMHEEDPQSVLNRAEAHADYWMNEAPNRFAPYNSTDDYDIDQY